MEHPTLARTPDSASVATTASLKGRSISELRKLAATLQVSLDGLLEKDDVVAKVSASLSDQANAAVETCDIKDLIRLAAAREISLDGLLERDEVVKTLRAALPDEVIVVSLRGLEVAGATSAVNSGQLTPHVTSCHEEMTRQVTDHIVATLRQGEQIPRSALLNAWHNLPDAAENGERRGMWCFVEAGEDIFGASLFYPQLYRNNLSMKFRNTQWMREEVRLEFGFVLCWCPAGYVWPYCMMCGKFVFPWHKGHRTSQRHQRAVQAWRRDGAEMTRRKAFELNHAHRSFFSLSNA